MPIPIDHQKLKRQSAKESAFHLLQQWIIDGTMQPGEKLNDSEIARALGISRTPVRESLQLLEVQGFVKMYPGKATQVTEVDKNAIYDLLPPLAVLQALATELAMKHIDDQVIVQLEQANQKFAEAIRLEDYFSALKLDEAFHQIIVDTAQNPYIHSIITSLQTHVSRLFFHNSIILTKQSIDDHNTIIEQMKKGEFDTAAAVMKENWLRALDEFTETT